MEIAILLGIPLLVLLFVWLQDVNSRNKNTNSSANRYKKILNKSQKDWKDKNAIYTGKEQKGKKGGRFRLRESKNGKKYRQYY